MAIVEVTSFVAALITIWDKVKALRTNSDRVTETSYLRDESAKCVVEYLSRVSKLKGAHDSAQRVRERCEEVDSRRAPRSARSRSIRRLVERSR